MSVSTVIQPRASLEDFTDLRKCPSHFSWLFLCFITPPPPLNVLIVSVLFLFMYPLRFHSHTIIVSFHFISIHQILCYSYYSVHLDLLSLPCYMSILCSLRLSLYCLLLTHLNTLFTPTIHLSLSSPVISPSHLYCSSPVERCYVFQCETLSILGAVFAGWFCYMTPNYWIIQ